MKQVFEVRLTIKDSLQSQVFRRCCCYGAQKYLNIVKTGLKNGTIKVIKLSTSIASLSKSYAQRKTVMETFEGALLARATADRSALTTP